MISRWYWPGLGELDSAVDRLEQGYKERTHWMALLRVDPQLDPLRDHPRFKRLHEVCDSHRRSIGLISDLD